MGGYALVVRATGEPVLDSALLSSIARAVAYRWEVPSKRRNEFAGLQRLRTRTLPPEPRWADDWTPGEQHRAVVSLTLHRNRKVRIGEPRPASGDVLFDRSLRSIASDPMPGAPALPAIPNGLQGDSLVVEVLFGAPETADGPGVIRFAASQSPVQLVPGTLLVVPTSSSNTPSAQRRATVKYDVTELGHVVPSSLEILESSDRELTNAIRDGLMRAQFRPAMSNCRAISLSVVQRFGR